MPGTGDGKRMGGCLALEGIRILTVEDFLALPWGTMLLADMGAEVIRIESHTRPASRRWPPFPENQPGKEWWNRSGTFGVWYRNKRSLTLDLAKPPAVELFKALVRVCDVVTENNRPGVMARLGLDYKSLRQVKPDLVMVSSSGFGGSGPWRNYGAFARTIDALSGLSYLTGYEGGPPLRGNPSYMDITTGWSVATTVLMALHHRRRTGKGAYIDLSMYETGSTCIGEELLNVQMNGRCLERIGNGHQWRAPQGCYPCRGDGTPRDRWVVISVGSDEEWRALRQAMAEPEWAAEPRYADSFSRYQHRHELDQHLGEWTREFTPQKLTSLLLRHGVPAGQVMDARDLVTDPHLRARGFFEYYAREGAEDIGVRPYVGRPFKHSKTAGSVRSVPRLGEDNGAILGGMLGLGEGELRQLEEQGIIGTVPTGPGPEVQPIEHHLHWSAVCAYDPGYRQVLGIEHTQR
ncbi:MAG: CoA transferase [Chloroflexi bacterium]|nr:CoA transferase [Chloroflexota bacterium]